MYHIPALLQESVDGLNIHPDGVYVDVTFGGGGHSREILRRLGEKGRLFAFDQDEDAYQNHILDPRFTFVKSNFRFLKNFMRYHRVDEVDGILADLGVSSHHFDDSSRGFSFRMPGDLDMRMNRLARKSAADILNEYSEERLSDIFFFYGELKSARKIAAAVASYRRSKKIDAVSDFLEIMKPFTFREKENKTLAQAFQALRIEVNDELKALEEMLMQGLQMLKPGGRFSIISYHSLEDRLVKNFFRAGNVEGVVAEDFFGNRKTPFELINRKVIVPTEEEQVNNPRSRSAKLRIAEKL
ncbi:MULTISPECIES: 16S rRNA (cytosine(1402)-N(4))-methyltransferase RsmH [Petrimonas]|jgi:16S rRNA (cytosine1402-N4)-methyltransferase|uniref:Ribosomal RNA small subunit methyltransferase H n=1 Tax=Petrimonas mucosa TaxID=1642646 RepID=A0A1G4G9Z9_9BACT|nr:MULTISPECIES: 16S rRNA (cytosine(1402)-N(4))-methyltransferase RsmH [Petrimonas]MDD3559876.1 16S rRNA (cytosine(1402)-N(4))-methyltransferase RsmH [Petrimonas mucosa]SCM59380.1 Ribosomal RNA small subunit methyltransferase H {ECO:0000255/HAMAP-Rule:MF_01007} [Petrimonas mucosa]SFU51315.1 16S rRNA (cytosine1402-N4)-methyltransferase [Porphyromonadaceae bacterium KHP3R9]HHT29976.1 16S rRNA (cytosine(1402)-N(4))-methyltransferase RsmH [Petrimonas mucosa]